MLATYGLVWPYDGSCWAILVASVFHVVQGVFRSYWGQFGLCLPQIYGICLYLGPSPATCWSFRSYQFYRAYRPGISRRFPSWHIGLCWPIWSGHLGHPDSKYVLLCVKALLGSYWAKLGHVGPTHGMCCRVPNWQTWPCLAPKKGVIWAMSVANMFCMVFKARLGPDRVEVGHVWSNIRRCFPVGSPSVRMLILPDSPILPILLIWPILPILPIQPILPILFNLPILPILPILPSLPILPILLILPSLPIVPILTI